MAAETAPLENPTRRNEKKRATRFDANDGGCAMFSFTFGCFQRLPGKRGPAPAECLLTSGL